MITLSTNVLFSSLFIVVMVVPEKNYGVVGTFVSREQKPNIILILTDDQDIELGSLNYMPKTLKAIKYQGAEFRHAYVTTPMCCPSRSSLLTGMYVHNHNVYTNNDNCSSTTWQTTYETRSFATYLSNAGYRTGYFGKYLNKYNGSYIPPGWREWGGLIMNSKYYNYSINMNGKKIKHGFDYAKDYYPDLIANDSIAFLRQSKKNNIHKPVMLTMSFPAPHGPEDSAPQYADLFFNVTSHHIPSYDYAPNPDKQWILQVTQKMQPIHKQFTDLLMTKRLQTLQSVDDAVHRVIEELTILGELHNTYVIYTSDHGYHLGQFGLIKGKSFPFEFDVRVPFLVRGPGIDSGSIMDEIVLNIDLAPTFLDIAGVETPPHMDGRSILPLFRSGKRKRKKWPDTFLIESSGRREFSILDNKMKKGMRRDPFIGRTVSTSTTASNLKNNITAENLDSTESVSTTLNEMYESGEGVDDDDDDDDDDDEDALVPNGKERLRFGREHTQNIQNFEPEIQEEELTNQDQLPIKNEQMLLDNRVLPGFIPLFSKSERLVRECSQPNMQKPCVLRQKWFCEYDNGRWRKHKCKSTLISSKDVRSKKYRKCSCVTAQGVVNKKIPVEFFRTMDRNILGNEDSLLQPSLPDTIPPVKSRIERNIHENVENITTGTYIDDIKYINMSKKTVDETKKMENRLADSVSGCKISGRGNVNCMNKVYRSKKIWLRSRFEINSEIQALKNKLEKLKEIRRHLKQYKPNGDSINSPYAKMDISAQHNVSHAKDQKKNHKFHESVSINKSAKNDVLETSNAGLENNLRNRKKIDMGNKKLYEPRKIKKKLSVNGRNHSSVSSYTPDDCTCEFDETDTLEVLQTKKKIDEEKMRRKARRQKKKENIDKQCSSEKMNCFHHDNDHWKTIPLWTNGPFCFCMNSNNNTYSCIRTINATHNFLYCEFTTGLTTFYNLRMDPFELQNRISQLKEEEISYLHDQLIHLLGCKGAACHTNRDITFAKHRSNISHKTFTNGYHNSKKKKNNFGGEKIFDGPSSESNLPRLISKNDTSELDDVL